MSAFLGGYRGEGVSRPEAARLMANPMTFQLDITAPLCLTIGHDVSNTGNPFSHP